MAIASILVVCSVSASENQEKRETFEGQDQQCDLGEQWTQQYAQYLQQVRWIQLQKELAEQHLRNLIVQHQWAISKEQVMQYLDPTDLVELMVQHGLISEEQVMQHLDQRDLIGPRDLIELIWSRDLIGPIGMRHLIEPIGMRNLIKPIKLSGLIDLIVQQGLMSKEQVMQYLTERGEQYPEEQWVGESVISPKETYAVKMAIASVRQQMSEPVQQMSEPLRQMSESVQQYLKRRGEQHLEGKSVGKSVMLPEETDAIKMARASVVQQMNEYVQQMKQQYMKELVEIKEGVEQWARRMKMEKKK
ncbi:MAG: hypothetical protein LBG13_01645 [Holosporales bacterium]|nr:hypothetical protein [Holosporales bacterium]